MKQADPHRGQGPAAVVSRTLTTERFRQVMGQFPTGVVAVTAAGDAGPLGLVIGSFNSLSLEPP